MTSFSTAPSRIIPRIIPLARLMSERVCALKAIHSFSSDAIRKDFPWICVPPYRSIKVDLNNSESKRKWAREGTKEEFMQLVAGYVKQWKEEGIPSVWLHIPIKLSHLIAEVSTLGFTFHHAHHCQAVLSLWLDKSKPSKIPLYGTHQVGVAGVVYREETDEVLVIQDKYKVVKWKFPGGFSDHAEDIAQTAVREVQEETGIQTEFKSVIAFRQHHHMPHAYDQSDLYFLCRLRPITYDIHPCPDEVSQCRWMNLNSLIQADTVTPLMLKVSELLHIGKSKGFDVIDISAHECNSIYPGLKYSLFYRM